MTNEQNALICRLLCGYEVQVSPASVPSRSRSQPPSTIAA